LFWYYLSLTALALHIVDILSNQLSVIRSTACINDKDRCINDQVNIMDTAETILVTVATSKLW